MSETLLKNWRDAFFQGVQTHETTQPLREAALAGRLGDWTASLTTAVVQSCKELGWAAAARGHLVDVLPVPRNEYLALDVMAFQASAGSRWPLPVAAFELENSPDNDRVAYALWKLLCTRVPLRVLFAYRRESAEGAVLAGYLADNVVGSLSIAERMQIGGDTLILIGNRAEGETFPYGYFKEWVLDTNTGRFARA
jgi:hypothetical protein